jgi:deoxyribose-phosphate aldolase
MQLTIASQTEYISLKPGTTIKEVEKLCKKAIDDNVAAVCVPPLLVEKAKKLTEGSSIKIATVIGYPYGYSVIEAKLAEIIMAMVDGADELDIVINMTALKNNDWQYLARELNTILPVIRKKQKVIKIIIETSLLSDDEIIKCCDLYGISGVDYISLSTGIEISSTSGEKAGLVRKHLADAVGIKISGIFKNEEETEGLIAAGAGRIGRFI